MSFCIIFKLVQRGTLGSYLPRLVLHILFFVLEGGETGLMCGLCGVGADDYQGFSIVSCTEPVSIG